MQDRGANEQVRMKNEQTAVLGMRGGDEGERDAPQQPSTAPHVEVRGLLRRFPLVCVSSGRRLCRIHVGDRGLPS